RIRRCKYPHRRLRPSQNAGSAGRAGRCRPDPRFSGRKWADYVRRLRGYHRSQDWNLSPGGGSNDRPRIYARCKETVMPVRNLKPALREGTVLVGTWVNTPTPSEVEIIGYAGFDFVMLDTEHSSYGIEAGEGLIRAADAARIPALMRVAENKPSAIGKALDYGAQGIVVPHIGTAEEARQAVRGARFAPAGVRGAAPSVR